MRGKASSARRIAQAMMCVKLILGCPAGSRCLLSSRRFSSSVRTAIVRTEVAVGIWRLASMFSTRRTAPPRIGCRMSPGRIAGITTALERSVVAGVAGCRASVGSELSGVCASGRGASFTMTVTGDGSGSGGRPSAVSK